METTDLLSDFETKRKGGGVKDLRATGGTKYERVQAEYAVIMRVLRRLELDFHASYKKNGVSSIYVLIPDGGFRIQGSKYWRISDHIVPKSPKLMKWRTGKTDVYPRRPTVFVTGAAHRRDEFWTRAFKILTAGRRVRIHQYRSGTARLRVRSAAVRAKK